MSDDKWEDTGDDVWQDTEDDVWQDTDIAPVTITPDSQDPPAGVSSGSGGYGGIGYRGTGYIITTYDNFREKDNLRDEQEIMVMIAEIIGSGILN